VSVAIGFGKESGGKVKSVRESDTVDEKEVLAVEVHSPETSQATLSKRGSSA